MIQIPKNKIVTDQYTNGTSIGNNLSLRFVNTKIPYIGFYNIINGNKYFSNKTYDKTSKPLERYNILSSSINIGSKAVSKFNKTSNTIRFFYKDLNTKDILIKEIDKNTFNKLNSNQSTSYQVISYNPFNQNLDDIDKPMPGLKTLVET